MMARLISQTLIRSYPSFASSYSTNAVRLTSLRRRPYSTTHSDSSSQTPDCSDAEALAVKRIEDAIHHLIAKRSAPYWLPFVPGASYWVPPKRRNYGIAQLVHQIANAPTDDQLMSLTTSRGWPSSAFYINDETHPHQTDVVETSSKASLTEDDEG